ncbi:hypothetical protein PspLS_09769 [Pyricularia sp. CBS 133598]|nr:hypothetical protein PspLS_09769 [Pyricularia sp. CBS 133598]
MAQFPKFWHKFFLGWWRRPLVTPITQWYTHATAYSPYKREIRSSWNRIVEGANKENLWRKEGWVREEYDTSKHIRKDPHVEPKMPPEGLGKYFIHTPAFLEKNTRLLCLSIPRNCSCRAHRNHPTFPARRRRSDLQYKYGGYTHVIMADEKSVGRLQVHRNCDSELFPVADALESDKVEVELVAICQRRTLDSEFPLSEIDTTCSDEYGVL